MADVKFLDGRTALVTGASSGIGRAISLAFAKHGASISIAARRENRLDELSAEIEEGYGVKALAVPTDVRVERQVEEMVKTTVDCFGGLDILVNNAGVGGRGKIEDLSTGDYRQIMETNIDGVFFATRAALPYLRESEGNLIFIGSFSGKYPRSSEPVYAATKWWVRGFALSVEARVGKDNVAVSIVNPSEVRSEIRDPPEFKPSKVLYKKGEVTEPEEVAEAVAFAAGHEHSTLSEIDIYRRDKLMDAVR